MVSFLVAVAALCIIYKCCPTLGSAITGCGCVLVAIIIVAAFLLLCS